MKRSLSFILTLVMVIGIITSVPVAVSAGNVDCLRFRLNDDWSSYYVDGCDTSVSGDLVIPDTYNGRKVTSINSYAFEGCEKLTSVTIPDTVTSISGSSFIYCKNLESVRIPAGVSIIELRVFEGCESLKSITIPEGVKFIDAYAFKNCSALESINIPEGVESIGEEAFYGCSSLKSIIIPESVTVIGEEAFFGCERLASVTAYNNITDIGYKAFHDTKYYNDTNNWENGGFYIANHLIEVESSLSGNFKVKKGTKSIYNAFYDCENLNSVEIPDSVTSIGSLACCYSLTSINVDENNEYYSSVDGVLFNKDKTELVQYPAGKTATSYNIPESVTSIGYSSFSGCSLESVIIPESVKNIDDLAFEFCDYLTSITIPDSVTSIGSGVFADTGYHSDRNNWEDGVLYIGNHLIDADQSLSDEYKIKDGTKTIAGGAFYWCKNLPSITIPNSVVGIGDLAFFHCESIASVIIPRRVKNIGESAFAGCKSLALVKINGDVANMGKNAFENCSNLTKVTISGATNIGEFAFANCKNLTTVILNEGVTNIGYYSFAWCEKLESISIPDSVKSIGVCAFAGCDSLVTIKIGEGVTSIGSGAFPFTEVQSSVYITDIENWCNIDFEDYSSNPLQSDGNLYLNGELVTDLVIPDGVTEIGAYAFENCVSFESVTIPDSVKKIGEWAFAYSDLKAVYIDDLTAWCNIEFEDELANPLYWAEKIYLNNKLIKDLVIPDGVKKLRNYVFTNCMCAETITIPKSVTSISETALGEWLDCLTKITVDKNNKYYSSVDGVLFNKDKTTLFAYPICKYEQTYEIPDSVTTIGQKAFCSMYSLNFIEISGNVKNIEKRAFGYCNDLISLKIEKGVKNIEEEAFFNCEKLTSVTIPESVTNIGEWAFGYYFDYNDYEIDKIDGFTIYGVEGTEAEAYAKANGFKFKTVCAHTSTKWVTDRKATVYKAGSKHKECTKCGEVLKTATIKQLKCSKPTLKSIENTKYGVLTKWSTVKGADKYRVYRKTSKTDWEYIGSTTNTYYTDKTAKSGTKYYYAVKAQNEAGNSSLSDSLSIRYLAVPTLKSIENTAHGVLTKWSKVSGAEKYYVYRKKDGSNTYTRIATTTNIYYTDKTAKSGTKYYYVVMAVKNSTTSASSSAKSIFCLEDPTLKTPSSTKSGVKLTWSKVTGAEGYMVYRKTGSGSYSKLATVKGSTKVTYTDASAKKGKKYTYKVKVYKGSTYSVYSNTKSITDKY